MTNCKGYQRCQLYPDFRYYPSIWLVGPSIITKPYVRLAGPWVEIWNQDLPHMKLGYKELNHDIFGHLLNFTTFWLKKIPPPLPAIELRVHGLFFFLKYHKNYTHWGGYTNLNWEECSWIDYISYIQNEYMCNMFIS